MDTAYAVRSRASKPPGGVPCLKTTTITGCEALAEPGYHGDSSAAAAATGAGGVALGLVGCGDDDDKTATAAPATAVTSTSPSTAATTAAATTAAAATAAKGGALRLTSANNTWDVFDIDRSIFSTIAAYLHGFTNSGVVAYKSFKDAVLEGGFADKWEIQSPTQITFTVKQGLKWHNKPPVNGRAATSADIKAFIIRNRDATLRDGTVDKSTFYRSSQYGLVDTVDTPDARTAVVKFKSPNIFFLDTLAAS